MYEEQANNTLIYVCISKYYVIMSLVNIKLGTQNTSN